MFSEVRIEAFSSLNLIYKIASWRYIASLKVEQNKKFKQSRHTFKKNERLTKYNEYYENLSLILQILVLNLKYIGLRDLWWCLKSPGSVIIKVWQCTSSDVDGQLHWLGLIDKKSELMKIHHNSLLGTPSLLRSSVFGLSLMRWRSFGWFILLPSDFFGPVNAPFILMD